MKRILTLIFALFCSSSCERVVEENLYNEYDEDWGLVQTRIEEQCKEAEIFRTLEQRSNFSSYFDDAYFEVKVSGQEDSDYIKIFDITSTELKIGYYSSQNPITGSMTISFTSTQNNSLIEAIKNGVCATDEDDEFGHNSVDRTSGFYFTYDRRQGTNDDNYDRRTDKYTIDSGRPLPLILWNRVQTIFDVDNGDEDKEEETYTISSITESACNSDDHDGCQSAYDDDWNFNVGTIVINESAYTSNDLETMVVELN